MSGSDPNNRRHPQSTFSTQYPYNQATITRSGHEFHINDAPDNESLKVAHTTGTYVEIEKSGRWVHTVVEKVYNYFKGTFSQTIDSHADIKVGGTYNFNVDASSYEAVAQNKTVGVGGDLIDGVGGVRQLHTQGDKYESINGSHTAAVKGDNNIDIEGSSTTSIMGTRAEILNNDWSVTGKNIEMAIDGDFRVKCKNFKVDAGENVTINADQNVNVNAAQNVTVNADGEISVTAQGGQIVIYSAAGPITVTAEGVVYINGTQIRLND